MNARPIAQAWYLPARQRPLACVGSAALIGFTCFGIRLVPAEYNFLAFALLGAAFVHLYFQPREGPRLLAVSAVLYLCAGHFSLFGAMDALGFASMLIIAVSRCFGSGELIVLKGVLALPALALTAAFGLKTFVLMDLRFRDAALYAIEKSLHYPSYSVGRVFVAHPFFREASLLIYTAIGFFLAVVYALEVKRFGKSDLVEAAILIGGLGSLIYLIYPAAGPGYFAGQGFPLHPGSVPDVFNSHGVAPNAMPSEHAAWALLIVWRARRLGLTLFGLVVFIGTCSAALGLGEHYLIDLVLALPFVMLTRLVHRALDASFIRNEGLAVNAPERSVSA